MKTVSDFKKAIQVGTKLHTIFHCEAKRDETGNVLRYPDGLPVYTDKDLGTAPVTIVQTTQFAIERTWKDGTKKDSWCKFPKAKHTPGPWSHEYDYSLVMNHQIVSVGPIGPDEASQEEKQANVRLIAAAPELLEALNTIQVCLTSWNEKGRYTNLIEHALTAIQKATKP